MPPWAGGPLAAGIRVGARQQLGDETVNPLAGALSQQGSWQQLPQGVGWPAPLGLQLGRPPAALPPRPAVLPGIAGLQQRDDERRAATERCEAGAGASLPKTGRHVV
jgi:hypothetical protein